MSFAGRINIPFKLEEGSILEGSVEPTWLEVAKLWGKISPSSLSNGATHKILARYRPDISLSVGQRVSYLMDRYLIVKVEQEPYKKCWVTLFVQEEKYLN